MEYNEKLRNISGWLIALGGFLLILFVIVDLPKEHRNYEVRGADGTIYHTTRIGHGTGRIWFKDEHGKRIELGGGYSVIEK